jgi:hypothetical protein
MRIKDLEAAIADADFTFLILHEGWEMDNIGWVKNGVVSTTSHGGRIYEMSASEIRKKIAEAESSIGGLKRALSEIENRE